MMPKAGAIHYKQGDTFWCDPDPKDTVGTEHKGDHVWGIVSLRVRKGCVVAIPLSRHIRKQHPPLLPLIPKSEFTQVDGSPALDRVALTDQIRSIDIVRLRKRSGSMSHIALRAVLLSVDYMLGKPVVHPNAN